MTVPETAVHENHGFVFPQNDVGSAGNILHVQAVTETVLPQPFADEDFRLGVFAADVRHVFVALSRGESVGHGFMYCISSSPVLKTGAPSGYSSEFPASEMIFSRSIFDDSCTSSSKTKQK